MAQAQEAVETSLSDDLNAVIDQLEGVEDDEEEGRPEEVSAEEKEPQEEVSADAEAEEPEHPVAQEKPQQPAFKPPIDWSPSLREHWKKLPPDVQKAVHDREAQVNNVMQQTAQDRRLAQGFNEVVSQYRGLMAAEGVQDPLQGIQGLLMTTAQLAMGNQQTKAQRIAALIQHYGVDIETLDTVLAGEQPQNNPDHRLEEMLNQRLAPVNQLLEQLNQSRQQQFQQVQTQATQSIEQFAADPQNEFFDSVRYAMADFLDVAAQNGVHMSLEEAYQRACALNPEINQITSQRQQAQSATSKADVMRRKATASSSVKGHRAGGADANAKQERSLREELEANFSGNERI
jgi:hypothetical protein